MIVKTFTRNKNNKIEFTGEELKELLDEVYRDGYKDGKEDNITYYTYCTPKWSPEPWWTYVTCNDSSNTTSGYINITSKEEK